MKKIIFVIIVTIILFLSGCISSVIHLKGRVLSNVNGEPIANAIVKLQSADIYVKTDSLGYFELVHIGGMPSKANFLVSKEGYKDFEIEFDSKGRQKIYKITNDNVFYSFTDGRMLCYDTIKSAGSLHAGFSIEKYSTGFTSRNDSIIFYLDLDIGVDNEFENLLKKHPRHKFVETNK